MPDETQEQLETMTSQPKRVKVDTTEVESHSLSDVIEADRYLSAKEASSKGFGMRRFHVKFPGAVADD
jgi:hypothetical protein